MLLLRLSKLIGVASNRDSIMGTLDDCSRSIVFG